MNTNIVLYVGANDGTICLPIAEKNKNLFIHAFEPNPKLVKKIKILKKKIEKLKNIKIENFKIHQIAVGIKNKKVVLNVANHDKVSSIKKLSKKLNKYWPGLKDSIFKTNKKINVNMITLSSFIKKYSIKRVLYLCVDTQGNDVDVLKGLKNSIHKVHSGKIEVAVNQKRAAYQNQGTISKAKSFLIKNGFKIIISKIDRVFNNEVDIFFFKNTNSIINIFKNINFRFYVRVLENRLSKKDNIIIFFIKFKNSLKKYLLKLSCLKLA